MSSADIRSLVEEATLDFTLGETEAAIEKLDKALALAPDDFDALHAKAEVHFSIRDLDEALKAAERAHAQRPDDIHINTSLSRIWMERGNKEKAEHYGAQARMLGWKEQLNNPPPKTGE